MSWLQGKVENHQKSTKKEELILNPLLNLTVKKRGKSTSGINLTEESEGKGSDFELTSEGFQSFFSHLGLCWSDGVMGD